MTTVTTALLTGVQEASDGDVGNLRGGVVLLLIFGWIGAFAVQMYRTRRRQRRVLEAQASEAKAAEAEAAEVPAVEAQASRAHAAARQDG